MPHMPQDFRPVPSMLGPVLQPPETGQPEPEAVQPKAAGPTVERPTEPRFRTHKKKALRLMDTISIQDYAPHPDQVRNRLLRGDK